ncbi:MAG: glycogen debranching enzyme N-terminal domain-containing protein [Burkholderiales bacterium]|nr:glycogen debranching enzyme N-terminal domain-containing protein [Burkholderiales bacterium]
MKTTSVKTIESASIRFGREICGDLAQAERREWWLANGLGAYAAGTIAGTLTRRYHGLLIAPVNPPLGRHLLFAKAEATLSDGVNTWPLSSNRWAGGAIAPRGYLHIESFHLDGRMPVWRYAIGDSIVEQRIWMEPGANTTYVAFRSEGRRGLRLQLKLLVNARDHHGNAQPWQFNPVIEADGRALRVLHPNWFALHFRAHGGALASSEQGSRLRDANVRESSAAPPARVASAVSSSSDDRTPVSDSGGAFTTTHDWFENFDLALEQERGLPASDAHLCVGVIDFDLQPGVWIGISASPDKPASNYLEEAMRRFRNHDAGLLRRAKVLLPEWLSAPARLDQLLLASDTFLFARPLPNVPAGESIIAGYPWFGDWGRDTMIALPGLTLATGRFESALNILQTFARFVDRGMLPNVFPGAGDKPEYNTVDAALWYVEAWRAYVAATADRAALREVFGVLESIIRAHRDGTRYGIGMDSDGLLRAGETGVQLTWMDAKVGDWVVTPRIGKPVEINALWYNALVCMSEFARQLNLPADDYRELAERARAGFQRFQNADNGGLFDVIDGPQGPDAAVRPNQIFAVSLPFSPLSAGAQAGVVALCGAELLTSYGLRSLSQAHADFRPHYVGGVWERDGAYHQGPVWPWLLGHYALAEYRVTGDADLAQSQLAPLQDHLLDAGLGTISEIFDGATPHTPRGAPAQAWSVACALEAWLRLERAKREQANISQQATEAATI